MRTYYVLIYYLCIVICTTFNITFYGIRSVHRFPEPYMPSISAYWHEQAPHYTIKDSHITEYPIFAITAERSYPYLIPETPITFSTHKTRKVMGTILKKNLEQLVQEIHQGKTTFTHFDILRKKDFNFAKKCGFIIVKYKQYPFVAKLSIERPDTFVDPFCKGIVPMFFFFMAGGSNRHMTGLTRILNLHEINHIIASNPIWRHRVKTPRKWFWLPENPAFFTVVGTHIGKNKKTITTRIPSIYAIIADAIDTHHEIPLATKTKNNLIIRLCNDLNLTVDPHEDNFIFQYDKITQKLIIIIVDTEHFLTMVGINEKHYFTGHADFYMSLTKKCTHDIFFRTKSERLWATSRTPDPTLLLG